MLMSLIYLFCVDNNMLQIDINANILFILPSNIASELQIKDQNGVYK